MKIKYDESRKHYFCEELPSLFFSSKVIDEKQIQERIEMIIKNLLENKEALAFLKEQLKEAPITVEFDLYENMKAKAECFEIARLIKISSNETHPFLLLFRFIYELCVLGNKDEPKAPTISNAKDIDEYYKQLEVYLGQYKDAEDFAIRHAYTAYDSLVKANEFMILGLVKYHWPTSGIEYNGWVSKEEALFWLKFEIEKGHEASLQNSKQITDSHHGLSHYNLNELQYWEALASLIKSKMISLAKDWVELKEGKLEIKERYAKEEREKELLFEQYRACLQKSDEISKRLIPLKKEKEALYAELEKMVSKSESDSVDPKETKWYSALIYKITKLTNETNSITAEMNAALNMGLAYKEEFMKKEKEMNEIIRKAIHQLEEYKQQLSSVEAKIKTIKESAKQYQSQSPAHCTQITPAYSLQQKKEQDIVQDKAEDKEISEKDKDSTAPDMNFAKADDKEKPVSCSCVIL